MEGRTTTVVRRYPCNKKSSRFLLRIYGGQGWIRTTVDSRRQIYSLLPLATRAPTHFWCPSHSFLSKKIAGNRNRTYNLRFTKPLLYRWAMPAYFYCIYKIILCQVIFFDFLQFILINMLEVVQIEDFYITFTKFFLKLP